MRKNKIIGILIFVLLLFTLSCNDVSAFPESYQKIKQVGSKHNLPKANGRWGAAVKKSKNDIVVFCTKYDSSSPAAGKKTCTLNTNWTTEVRAGVAAIIRAANISNSISQSNNNYVFVEMTINDFLADNDYSGKQIKDHGTKSAWKTAAKNKKKDIETIKEKIKVTIGSVTVTQDDTAFYLTIPLSKNYGTASVTSVTHGTKLSDGRYKILKSKLNEGSNTITIKAKTSYSDYVARNYSCGSGYQTVTPNRTESIEIASDTASKKITLNKNSKGNIKITKTNSSTGEKISGVGFTLYTNSTCTSVEVNEKKTNTDGEVNFNNLSVGTYYYRETKAPSNFVANTGCNSVNVTSGNTTNVTVTNEPYGKILLNKIKANGTYIQDADISMSVYTDAGCTKLYKSYDCNTGMGRDVDGNTCKFSVPKGNYWIKETSITKSNEHQTPYVASFECKSVGHVNPNASTSVNYINRTQCELDVVNAINDGTINTVSKRIQIYKNVSNNGTKHRNLLNFEKVYVEGNDKDEFASDLCENPNCSTNRLDSSCLSIDGISNFSDTNWSCYKETLDISSKVGYCYTNFKFDKNDQIPSTVNQEYTILGQNVKAGQFIFKTPILGTSKITETCYFVENLGNEINKGKVGDYLEKIKFNDEDITSNRTTSATDLQNNFILEKEEKNVLNSTIYKYEGQFSEDYRLNEVLAEKIKGENCDVESNKCVGIGYGLISKFNDAKEVPSDKLVRITGSSIDYIKVPFEVSFKSGSNLSTVTDETCVYSVQPEIIEYQESTNGKLELEFRSIDKNKPFNRKTNANWCGEGDNPCNSNNTTVQRVIKERNDSYNRTGAGALYTNQTDGTRKIVLTPDKIQQIKDYNRRVGSYNDYTNYTNIVEGEEITSTAFLDELEIRKVS